jgi:serine/threonine protein kinase/WD40 repeat protein
MNATEYIAPQTPAPRPGAPDAPLPSPDDPRVVLALEQYSAALKAGQRPDRNEFLARYPEIATALSDCLEALEFVQAAAPLLQGDAGGQTSAASAASEDFYPGGPLGDYRIVREIGRGGMGVVYEAVQISLIRRVALKVLPFAATLDAKHLQRFKNESLAAAQLHHQNIVPVYGVGCERGVHYYAMQFIDGQTLAAMIAGLRRLAGLDRTDLAVSTTAVGPLISALASGRWQPPQEGSGGSQPPSAHTPLRPDSKRVGTSGRPHAAAAPAATAHLPKDRSTVTSPAFFRTAANLGVQAALALEHAHQVGVVHRDVKPANLLVDGRGNLWITDFGLAHCQSQAGLTVTGDLLGTLRYMSPEQALAQRIGIDHRTDIYSLGATLYELLTLEPLFGGSDRQALLRQIAFEEPKPPRRWNKRVPAELETIVLKALEKAPDDRYATASALADDLGRFLKDESILAKRPSRMQRARKWARRNPSVVRTALVALALLLVTIAVGTSLAAWRLNKEQSATRDQLRLTEQAQERSMHRLYEARLAQARAGSLSRRVGQRFESLGAVAHARKIARHLHLGEERMLELRNAAIACLALPDLRIAKEWNGWPTGSLTVNFDRTLERYARVDRQGVVHIQRVADNDEICRLPGMGPGEAGAWFSPNGRFLALRSADARFKVWDLAGSRPVVVVEEVSGTSGNDFSPDSSRLALGRKDGSIRLYELPAGRQLKQLKGIPTPGWPAFHPSGRQLALSCATGVQVYDLNTGNILAELPQPAGADCLAWHPDGKTLAVDGGDQIIHIWDVAARKPIARLEGHKGDSIGFRYSNSGDLLVSTSWDGTMRLWDPQTGRQLFNRRGWVQGLRFSPDDRYLAAEVADTNLRIWEVARPSAYRTLVSDSMLGRASPFNGCAISPDGRLLAVTQDSGVSFWDLPRRRQLAIASAGQTRSVLFESCNALLSGGTAGLLRWPIEEIVGEAGLLRIGPPTRLLSFWGVAIGSSSGGGVITSPQQTGAVALDKHHPDRPIPLAPHADARYTAVSPDGQWAVTGSHWYTKVKIWAARTGKLVKELPIETGSSVGFSPDGKWLATTGGGLSLWEVGSWNPGKQIGGGAFAFAPDSQLLAVETGHGVIRLVSPDSGQEYARLEDPNQERACGICFSPDGAHLIAPTHDSQSIHIWDLRAIREQLVKMGLDWALRPYPPAPEVNESQPLRIQVELGEQAELPRDRAQIARQEIEQQRRALAANPDDAAACNSLAWNYLTAPEALRDVKAALALALKAVQLEPNPMFRNTLGLAYYRAGRYREAVAALEPNLKDQVDWALAFDLYFLAMSDHQLGERAEARQFYDLAVRWSDAHVEAISPYLTELTAVQAEAAELLGVRDKKH